MSWVVGPPAGVRELLGGVGEPHPPLHTHTVELESELELCIELPSLSSLSVDFALWIEYRI